MLDRARKNEKIKFITNTVVVDVLGKDKVEGVKIKDTADNSEKEMPVDGVFVAIGHSPVTKIFKGQVDLDEKGYVVRKETAPLANGEGSHAHFNMATSVEGVFVAGDVHDFHYKQAVTAAGYGCAAALEAERWIEMQE